MNATYYDIGVNLFCRQFKDPEKIAADAASAGVGMILTGSDMEENRLVDAFTRSHAVYGTAGIHPHNADDASEADFAEMEAMLRGNGRLVAVGECGLDYDRMFSEKEKQLSCLVRHIGLAEKLGMPMFLHERDAAADMVRIFEGHPEQCRRSVIHCFTGDRRTAERYLEMGFFIGITGWICDERRADALRDAAAVIPADRILLETDAPYLVPRGIPGLGRVNLPQNIVYVARTLAGYMGIAESELIRHARENTERLFGIGGGADDNG